MRGRRIALVIVVAIAAAVQLAHLSSHGHATATELSHLTGSGVIRVCSSGDYRPFTYVDEHGTWSGLDMDMAIDLAARLGVRLDVVRTTWHTLLADVGTKCDMAMGGISITPDRSEQALFSVPYLHDGKAAIGRCADSGRFHGLDDIDVPGVRVIVNPGGGNADFDRTHLRHALVKTWPDNDTIFDALAAGAADVMITDVSEIRWQTAADSHLCGIALDRPFTAEQKAYLFPASSTALQQWTNGWLGTVMRDGTYAALSRRYFGASVVSTPAPAVSPPSPRSPSH